MRITVCELTFDQGRLPEAWEALADHCRRERSELVVLPEMPFSDWLAATPDRDQAAWERTVADHDRWMGRLGELGAAVVVGSAPVVDAGANHNEAFTWTPAAGRQAAHLKRYLPDEPGFWEARWYERGPAEFALVPTEVASVGFLLCTEMWFTEHARAYARGGIEVLASPRATGIASRDKWIAGGRAAAVMSGAFCAGSNRSGTAADGFTWGGAGWIIEPEEGEVLGVTTADEPFLTIDVDLGVAAKAKSTYPRYVEQ
jgi:N-carbamoylputrescine amidase